MLGIGARWGIRCYTQTMLHAIHVAHNMHCDMAHNWHMILDSYFALDKMVARNLSSRMFHAWWLFILS